MSGATDRRAATLAIALGELRAGRLDNAESLCCQMLASTKDDPAAYQLAAAVALQQRKLDDAKRWVDASLALRADHSPTLVVAGRIARAVGDLAGAASLFQQAALVSPERPEPAFLACVTRLEFGDPHASAAIDGLLQRFPDYAQGWLEIGEVLDRAGQSVAAAIAFARAAQSSNDPSYALRLGASLQKLGRPVEAIAAYRRALAIDSNSSELRLALGLCLRLTGDLAAAQAELETAAVGDRSDGRAWFALGLVCEDLRDTMGAIRAYRRSVQLRPEFPEAYVNLGLNLQNSGDLDAAMQSYREAMRLRGDTFGRIAQALSSAKKGRMYLDLRRLRRALSE
jgi:tetratricopeptide (TPR) repeat protein